MPAIASNHSPMLEALGASGPGRRNREQLMQFGVLVGSWDLDVIYYDADGSVRRRVPGEWHFGWVLEGRAIQDVWIVPPRSQRNADADNPGEYGTTLRFYDERIEAWRSTWHGPVNGVAWPFIAQSTDGEIVLERTMDSGELTRWVFSSITESSFHWRAISSTDCGKTWHLDQEMFATRMRAHDVNP